jgi:transcription initiation factor TFIIIB Brf1 subunit/transcription initiation factor TFIIB
MSQRKFLSCPTCGTKKWAHKVVNLTYRCKTCETEINLAVLKQKQQQERQKARAFKKEPKKKRPTKKTRPLDKAFMAWVHEWPCLVPECRRWPVHAHHSVPRSRGGSDRTAIPLCHEHHNAYHSQLGSVEAAEKEWFVDIEETVESLNEKFEQGVRGPFADRQA